MDFWRGVRFWGRGGGGCGARVVDGWFEGGAGIVGALTGKVCVLEVDFEDEGTVG